MESSSKITCDYFNHPLGQIHYRHIPPNPSINPPKSPILFLHKSASSSASYNLLMTYYSHLGHPCYAPDMPGFGNSFNPSPSQMSSQPTNSLSTTWYINLYIHIFGPLGLNIQTPYHIFGHHSGASLAMEMAASYPEIVKSAILIGASIMTASERAAMKEIFFAPFNEPVLDGSHLLKTWNYLLKMGPFSSPLTTHSPISESKRLEILQREFLDHARAWQGRNQIYGAVWDQDSLEVYKRIRRPVLVLCARDDVLWEFFHHVREVRPEVRTEVLREGGGNFSLDFCWGEIGEKVDAFWGEEFGGV